MNEGKPVGKTVCRDYVYTEMGVSEFLRNETLGKFILPKWADGKDMIQRDWEVC
jgi:hypothetical protein